VRLFSWWGGGIVRLSLANSNPGGTVELECSGCRKLNRAETGSSVSAFTRWMLGGRGHVAGSNVDLNRITVHKGGIAYYLYSVNVSECAE
jgi:hypothetical protein